MVSDSTYAIMANYVSKVLEDVPQFAADKPTAAGNIGTLAVLSCSKMLSNLRTSSGLTVLRGTQFIAAAQLLNALVMRLSAIEETQDSNIISTLLAKSLVVACTSIVTVSTPRITTATIGSEGNSAVRDALYGVICILSRTKLALGNYSWLFAGGKTSTDSQLSTETAALLFGCVANEEETLRPRAVAALDALLTAYCRTQAIHEMTSSQDISEGGPANPWSQVTTSTSNSSSQMEGTSGQNDLAKSLFPLIWTASQHSRPKQSRVAAARWSSDLLTALDLTSACHLLCFLAGDSDVTAAAIAKEGLGLQKASGKEESKENMRLPDFAELTQMLFSESHDSSSSWRPTFWEFSPKGKAGHSC
jgi:hypothetical protein